LAIFVRLGVGLGVLGSSVPAHADDGLPPPPPSMDPNDALNPISIVSGPGVQVGEGTVFHPQIGVETGVVSNVFYQDSGPVTAGLLRILAEVGTGSLPQQRLSIHAAGDDQDPGTPQTLTSPSAGDFQYSASLYASWDQYLSANDNVSAQGGLGGGLLLRGIVNPQHPLQFAFQEHFSRVIRATNFESRSDTNRDLNDLNLRVNYLPSGRSLSGYLYYQNTIDVFEADSQQFANRLQNLAGLRVNWQWLPLTRVFADVSAGYFTGIGSSQKVNSYPVTVMAGIQTALTLNVTFNARVGYTNGFYASGPSYSSLVAGAMLGYRYSPLGRVTALYSYDHQDSINANFYRDHLFQASIEQYLVPFVVFARPELRLRQYDGTIVMGTTGNTRNDLIVGATVGMRYSFRDWIAGTLDYQLSVVQTDFKYNPGAGLVDDPSYVRHELLLGVRAAY
jgi:opacity protein-like surface antigen